MSKSPARPTFAYVGCFTTAKRKAKGKGIALFRIDPASGAWTFVEVCDAIPNPSYICLDRTQRFMYSAHGDSDEVCSYARDLRTGKLKLLNKQKTEGDNSSTRPRITSDVAGKDTARESPSRTDASLDSGSVTMKRSTPLSSIVKSGLPGTARSPTSMCLRVTVPEKGAVTVA